MKGRALYRRIKENKVDFILGSITSLLNILVIHDFILLKLDEQLLLYDIRPILVVVMIFILLWQLWGIFSLFRKNE